VSARSPAAGFDAGSEPGQREQAGALCHLCNRPLYSP
jgi:hypothetical protein